MSVSVRLCAGAHCISWGGAVVPSNARFSCHGKVTWEFKIQDPPRGKKKLEETAGSHHNFVPLEALPIPMLSEYHKIISDNQLYDFTFKPWTLQPLGKHPSTPNHLRNGTLLAIFFNVTNQGSLERPVASSQGCGLQCRWNFGCCQKWIARNLYLGKCGTSTLMVQTSGDHFVGCFCK